MTSATISANGRRPATDDLRDAARDAYRASLAAGAPLSGAALGRRFDMSDRWGRDRVAEVQRYGTSSESRSQTADRDTAPVTKDEQEQTRDLGPGGQDEPLVGTAPVAVSAEATSDRDAIPSGWSWLDSAIILIVAAVAAAASYGHMLEVALHAGEPLWIARAFPVTVDGLVLAALRRGRQGRWWLALGIAVSVAANMLARYPDLAAVAGPIVSAWPPLALFGTHRLLQADRRLEL